MFRRSRSGRGRMRRGRSARSEYLFRRKPLFEALEDRRLLAVMTVTNLDDGTLPILAGGGLSLREAVEAINTGADVDGIERTSGVYGIDDEIVFDPALFAGGPQTITLNDTAAELALKTSITITGPGAALLTIDAGNGANHLFGDGDGFRIFNIDDSDNGTDSPVTILGLTLTGGDVTGDGGAIQSLENLTVRDSVITSNAASSSGGGVYASLGTTTITDSTISGNMAALVGGGIHVTGGTPTLMISNGTISGNMANNGGGGINGSFATTMITNSTIFGNTTNSSGGGVRGFRSTTTIINSTIFDNTANSGGGFSAAVGTTTITGSTIFSNSASTDGGGVWADLQDSGGALTIANSTVSGNMANGAGGGVWTDVNAGQTLTIQHSTITLNRSNDDSVGGGSGGGVYLGDGAGAAILEHTIIAGNLDNSNVAPDLDNTTAANHPTLTARFNLIGDNTGSGLADGNPDGDGNIIGTNAAPIDPLLGPLNPNGGPTQTHALLAGSPAIDAGNPAAVAGMGGIPEFDQRGNPFLRLFDAGGAATIDIGAYERQTVIGLSLVVDILADENDGNYSPGDLSLREAVGLANGSVGSDTITFAPSLNGGTIVLMLGELVINDAVSISASGLAAGITVDASGNDPTPGTDDGMGSRIFNVDDATDTRIVVTLTNLTLTGGDSDSDGGAIFSDENLTISDSTISGNHSEAFGGGISSAGGDLLIQNSIISENSAESGSGGVDAYLGESLTLTSSTVSGNNAGGDGGGIYASEVMAVTISDSTISGNFATGNGGGVFLCTNDTATITNSTISGNRANGDGGGVYADTRPGDTTTISHSTITGNTADDDDNGSGSGGGLYATGEGTLTLTHTIVAGNTDNAGNAPDVDVTSDPPGTFNRSFNLIGDNTGSGLPAGNPDGNGNLIGTAAAPIDPLLDPLADNGGPTMTHQLQFASPAVDAGDPGFSPPPDFDQRGNPYVRVFDGDGNGSSIIDIGAFEITAFELVEPDRFEPNDTLQTATVLGSDPFVTLRDLSIHPDEDEDDVIIVGAGNGQGGTDDDPEDQDWFKYTAHFTGKAYFRILFSDDFGDLQLEVTDMFSNVLATSFSESDNEEVIIPVVSQEMYFIHVFGALPEGADDEDFNNYELEVENFPAPVPTGVHLDPASDTGMMNNDNVTSDTTPTFFIQTDVLNFVDTNNDGLYQDPDGNPTDDQIEVLLAEDVAEILAGNFDGDEIDSGIAVEITLVNTTNGTTFVIGYADPVIMVLPDVFHFTPTAPLTPGVYLVSARTKVFDGQGDTGGQPDQAMGRSNASPPLWITIDDNAEDVTVTAELLTSSDTGMLDDDNVTKKWEPAFHGVAPMNYKVRLYANGELVGQTVAGSDTSDVFVNGVGGQGGQPDDGLGLWEITTEPLNENGYDIMVEVEDAAGNTFVFDPVFNPNLDPEVDIVIDKTEPNTPYLDLLDDTGRSNVDNITKDNTPEVSMTSTDPNVAFSELLFTDNLKFRIYDRYESTAEFKLYDSALDAIVDASNTPGDMFTSLTQVFAFLPEQYFNQFGTNNAVIDVGGAGALADGVHNLKLEVEDRAGNISHDFLLTIIVDTTPPPVSFGLPDAADATDGLAASSDTGVTTMPATYADRVTSDTTPTMWGRAEADSIVRLYLDRNANGVIDLSTDTFLGLTVAVPYDGNDAYPDGYWEITSALDLNQIVGLPKDGLRRLLVTAEDQAGNPMPMNDVIRDGVGELQIFIDTQGPQVTAVSVNDLSEAQYDLFDPKPSVTGPTPLVNSLVVHVRDLPNRASADFLYEAIKEDIAEVAGNYLLVGDHVGAVVIQSVVATLDPAADGQPATATIELFFPTPLPDDRYTFTISDNLVDPAGNHLDGESNADEPTDIPTFPSGDGVPGGSFIARFTVDSRPEIGSYVSQNINIDVNGNFVWDPANSQIGNDATNVDISWTLPVANADGSIGLGGFNVHDLLFAGKFGRGQLLVGDDAVFVIDVSGSTSGAFGGDPIGDQNNDGSSDTILDAEIAAFKLLNQQLIDRGLGNTALVSIVSFDSVANGLDMDPVAAGVQLTTTPLADANSNGMRDVEEVLMSLNSGGGTDFEVALQEAINTINTAGFSPGNGNVVFLSDGLGSGDFADEVNTIRNLLQMNLRAFGVGPGASLTQLLTIDPDAETFSNTNELLAAFAGGGAGGGGGFDQLAAFGNSAQDGGVFRWIIDTNSDGVVTLGTDIKTFQPLLANFNVSGAIPVAGNFDGMLANGDEIGLYYSGKWGLDFNRNFVIEANEVISTGLFGRPIVGDFDGDGNDDLAVFNNNQFFFDFAAGGFGVNNAVLTWGFPGVLDQPVAADMDQDGIDDIGLWVPRTSATPPSPLSQWYFLISNDPTGNLRSTGTVNRLNHAFTPVPFGKDLYAEFGDDRAMPIVGNFDPPVIPRSTNNAGVLPGDYDGNNRVDQADYTVWKSNFGSRSDLTADGNGDGVVDSADYSIWRDNLGAVGSAAVGQAAASQAAIGDGGGSGQMAASATSSELAGAASREGSVASTLFTFDLPSPFKSESAEPVLSTARLSPVEEPSLLLLLDSGSAASVDEAIEDFGAVGPNEDDDAGSDFGDGALAVAWQSWNAL